MSIALYTPGPNEDQIKIRSRSDQDQYLMGPHINSSDQDQLDEAIHVHLPSYPYYLSILQMPAIVLGLRTMGFDFVHLSLLLLSAVKFEKG